MTPPPPPTFQRFLGSAVLSLELLAPYKTTLEALKKTTLQGSATVAEAKTFKRHLRRKMDKDLEENLKLVEEAGEKAGGVRDLEKSALEIKDYE